MNLHTKKGELTGHAFRLGYIERKAHVTIKYIDCCFFITRGYSHPRGRRMGSARTLKAARALAREFQNEGGFTFRPCGCRMGLPHPERCPHVEEP